VKLIGLINFFIILALVAFGRFGKSFAFGSFKYYLVAHITISLLKTNEMDAITPSLTIVASHVPNA
jgi:hypothetical protein